MSMSTLKLYHFVVFDLPFHICILFCKLRTGITSHQRFKVAVPEFFFFLGFGQIISHVNVEILIVELIIIIKSFISDHLVVYPAKNIDF